MSNPLEFKSDDERGVDLARGEGPKKWTIIGGAVLLILAGLLFASDHHSEALRISKSEGIVSVEKGIFAPFGWSVYRPTGAFEPVSVSRDVEVSLGECVDIEDCESRLFAVVLAQARLELRRPERMKTAMALIAQASKLAGPQDRETLRTLEDDEQLAQGKSRVLDARKSLTQAKRYFGNVRGSGEALESARRWTSTVDAVLKELGGEVKPKAKDEVLQKKASPGPKEASAGEKPAATQKSPARGVKAEDSARVPAEALPPTKPRQPEEPPRVVTPPAEKSAPPQPVEAHEAPL